MATIVKGTAGTEWWVLINGKVVATFDDIVKAQGYIDELRKADNDRIHLVQEEGIQITERGKGMASEGEEELRRD